MKTLFKIETLDMEVTVNGEKRTLFGGQAYEVIGFEEGKFYITDQEYKPGVPQLIPWDSAKKIIECDCKMKCTQVGMVVVNTETSLATSGDECQCEKCGRKEIKNCGEPYSVDVDKMKECAKAHPEIFKFV